MNHEFLNVIKALGTFSIATLLVSTPLIAEATRPMKACVSRNSGAVTIKPKCSRSETVLSIRDLAVTSQVGPQGPKGDTGAAGPQGIQGTRGETGATGSAGAPGPVGPQGATGNQGPRGERGFQGERGAVGPVGDMGPIGPQGIQGAQGLQGIRGVSGFDVIPQGTTIHGVVGADYHSTTTNTEWSITESLQGIAPVTFSNELVVIQNSTAVDNECDGATCLGSEELTYSNHCDGTADYPTAPMGWLCIYPTSDSNAASLRAIALPSDNGRYGFLVKWTARNSGRNYFRAVWAYTAP